MVETFGTEKIGKAPDRGARRRALRPASRRLSRRAAPAPADLSEDRGVRALRPRRPRLHVGADGQGRRAPRGRRARRARGGGVAMDTVGIVGAGMMGSGIAEAVAVAGLRAIVYEPEHAPLERSCERIEASLEKARGARQAAARRGRRRARRHRPHDAHRGSRSAPSSSSRPSPSTRRSRPRSSARSTSCVGPDVILASNTSSIPITTLAAATARPHRVLGLHFFSPVPVMGLVEIVPGLQTSEEVVRGGGGLRPPRRQARDPLEGPRGLPRQRAADPLPRGRRAAVRRRPRHARGHRRRHAPGLRPPDGAARAVRLHRPRRRPRDLHEHVRRVPARRVQPAAAAAAHGLRRQAGPQDGSRVL